MSFEIILVLLFIAGGFLAIRFSNRSADRERALRIIGKENELEPQQETKERKQKKLSRIYPLLGALAGLGFGFIRGSDGVPGLIIPALSGFGAVVLVSRVLRERKITQAKEEVEFYLPVFMEQVVMGVQAGLDVVPAIRESLVGGACGKGKLRELLEKVLALTERGVTFTESLDSVGKEIDIPTVRHAFIHLKLAFSQGGELVRPLRELSDATQLQYQESVEEEIAKLPVKAVMPLVLTFAGLMICFLTVPIVQLSTIMKSVTPQEISK